MTAALRLQATASVTEIIHGLETARTRPDELLRQALTHAGEIAPAVIALVEKSANGTELLESEHNFLFWGIHVIGAGRCQGLYQPLIRFIRGRSDQIYEILGDATTATLPKIVLAVFDGDAAPLLEACADRNVDDFVRWEMICILARLTFDGAVPRETTLAFLDRFDREPLADPDDEAWQGWQDAISLLGIEEMRDRLIGAIRNGRFLQDDRELDFSLQQLTVAQNLVVGDAALFIRAGLYPINDPVEALGWVSTADDDHIGDNNLGNFDLLNEFAFNDEGEFLRIEPGNRIPVRTTKKIGRNEPCPCGSGKKYKRCCGSPANSIN
jgi:uncharacterized protein